MNNHTHGTQHQIANRASRRNGNERTGRKINRKTLMNKRREQTLGVLGIQPAGLKVGAANDKYEQEADKVAEHVVNSPAPMGGAISPNAGGAQRAPRAAGRNLEIDRDEGENILTKRINSPTDEVTDDKETAHTKPLQRAIARDASEDGIQRMAEPDDAQGKIERKPIEISRMPAAKGDEDAMKMHDESDLGADEGMDMGDAQTSRLQRDAQKGYEDEANMKPMAQRQCATCESEAKRKIQRRGKARNGAFTASKDVSRNVQAMKRSGGRPLPASERAYLEPRFGRDLSHVRLHTDDRAAKTSQAIQAKAFTVGNNIAFNKGYYQPGTHEGRKLLAHEITHTIQQTGGAKKGSGNTRGVSRANREVVQRKEEIASVSVEKHGGRDARFAKPYYLKIYDRSVIEWRDFLRNEAHTPQGDRELRLFMALAVARGSGNAFGHTYWPIFQGRRVTHTEKQTPTPFQATKLAAAMFTTKGIDLMDKFTEGASLGSGNRHTSRVLQLFSDKFAAPGFRLISQQQHLSKANKDGLGDSMGVFLDMNIKPEKVILSAVAAAGGAALRMARNSLGRTAVGVPMADRYAKAKNALSIAASSLGHVVSALHQVKVDQAQLATKLLKQYLTAAAGVAGIYDKTGISPALISTLTDPLTDALLAAMMPKQSLKSRFDKLQDAMGLWAIALPDHPNVKDLGLILDPTAMVEIKNDFRNALHASK